MIEVTWGVQATTIVKTDDEAEAIEEVKDLFENRYWGETGKCKNTVEMMEIEGIRRVVPTGPISVLDKGTEGVVILNRGVT